MTIQAKGFHNVAYRCRHAKETVEFYQKHLNMDFQSAIAEDHVPSIGAHDPYIHIFLDAGNDNVLAFFERPKQPDVSREENTPIWVQHIAIRLENLDALLEAKDKLEATGLDVLGPTHHGIFKSIYFFDTNGHRLELVADIHTYAQIKQLREVAPTVLTEWNETKTAPRCAARLHEKIKGESLI